MRKINSEETARNDSRGTDRLVKLLELLRAARAPEPSPGYLAAFWPRLRQKLPSRRRAIIQPLRYGGLAAAAAALILWVTLAGTERAGRTGPASPVYALATASSPAAGERPETNYVSGTPRGKENDRRAGTDYVLPRISARENGRLEV